jgi:hypothetical protein
MPLSLVLTSWYPSYCRFIRSSPGIPGTAIYRRGYSSICFSVALVVYWWRCDVVGGSDDAVEWCCCCLCGCDYYILDAGWTVPRTHPRCHLPQLLSTALTVSYPTLFSVYDYPVVCIKNFYTCVIVSQILPILCINMCCGNALAWMMYQSSIRVGLGFVIIGLSLWIQILLLSSE